MKNGKSVKKWDFCLKKKNILKLVPEDSKLKT